MLFSSKPKIVIYITKRSIQVIVNAQRNEVISFHPDVVSGGEVTDSDRYFRMLKELFYQLNLPQAPALIVLGEDLVFEKMFEQSQPDLEGQANRFYEMVPIESNEMVKKTVVGGRIILLAANRGMYLPIVEILERIKCKTLGVVPASFFLNRKTPELDREDLKQVLTQLNLVSKTDLLKEERTTVSNSENTEVNFMDSGKMTLILLLIIVGSVASFWYFFLR